MSATALFTTVRVGDLELPNRIIMAPMTRRRTGPGGVPTQLNATYYAQRASAGMIVSEAAVVAAGAGGVPGSPGIYTDPQVAGWRRVTDAVHEAGGLIWLQLWHAGRVSHPDWLDGARPVAPSAVAVTRELNAPPDGPYPVPRALEREELQGVVESFVAAARRAREAGFDGVEIHAAQGYLLDQFLRDSANRRDDEYGGTPENRARLLVEVAHAVAMEWSPGRVGIQVSPTSVLNDMSDSDPRSLFTMVAERLSPIRIGYLHIHEPTDGRAAAPPVAKAIRERFDGPIVLNGGHNGATGAVAVAGGYADMISFGRPFIVHPDLPARLAAGARLRTPDPATFYGGGAEGYTDYPTLSEEGTPAHPA